MNEILIGYVKDFTFHHDKTKEMLNDHPKSGQIYRIIKSVTKDSQNLYQVYVGRETNEAHMDTIFLGNTLKGDYFNKWSFDIELVEESNYLEYDFKAEDLIKLREWTTTGNSDLKDLMEKSPKPVDMDIKSGEVTFGLPEGTEAPIKAALEKISHRHQEISESLESLHSSLEVIVDNDLELGLVIADLLKSISKAYSDKYENSNRPNFSKQFLMSSESREVALFNALKYIQRYCTNDFEKSGNVKDLHKAIHYCLFELQRRNIND